MRLLWIVMAMAALAGCANESSRRQAIENLEIVFKPSVFAGEKFPEAEFAQPLLARHLLGRYHISTRYFDGDFKEVSMAALPGRYGARTQVLGSRAGEQFIR